MALSGREGCPSHSMQIRLRWVAATSQATRRCWEAFRVCRGGGVDLTNAAMAAGMVDAARHCRDEDPHPEGGYECGCQFVKIHDSLARRFVSGRWRARSYFSVSTASVLDLRSFCRGAEYYLSGETVSYSHMTYRSHGMLLSTEPSQPVKRIGHWR